MRTGFLANGPDTTLEKLPFRLAHRNVELGERLVALEQAAAHSFRNELDHGRRVPAVFAPVKLEPEAAAEAIGVEALDPLRRLPWEVSEVLEHLRLRPEVGSHERHDL